MTRLWLSASFVSLLALTGVAAQKVDPAAALFDDSVVHEIRLYINSADWADLQANWLLDNHYPADFKFDGQLVRNVSVRSHGTGSRRPNKMSLKIGFNHYSANQRFLGLEDVLLRNNSQDPTNMRERLAMHFFRVLGVPAEREAHTRVFVNDQFYGLFTICEEYDTTSYLTTTFGEANGRLYEYKYDDAAVLAGAAPYNFEYLGPSATLYVPRPFEPKWMTTLNQGGDVIGRMMAAISDSDAAGWRDEVAPFLDLRTLIREVAIENYLGEEDGLTGDYGPNNFYMYRLANSTSFRLLPWDKSNTFWDAPSADYGILRNIVDGIPSHRDSLVLRAFQEPDLYNLWLDTLLECATFDQPSGSDQPGWLANEATAVYQQIHDTALQDTTLYSNDEFEQAAADLIAFTEGRSASVRAQVAAVRSAQP